MGGQLIVMVVVLTAVAANEVIPVKVILDTNLSDESTVNSGIEIEKIEQIVENSGKDLSKTMELILFKPYISESQDTNVKGNNKINENNNTEHIDTLTYFNLKPNVTKNATNDNENEDKIVNNTIIINPDIESFTTIEERDDHINKRNAKLIDVNNEDVEYFVEDDSNKADVTSRPYARYEITENVVDIPDDRTPAGPVIHNFSPYRNTPLNLGTPKNNTEVKTETADEDNKSTKSRISILHIKADIEEPANDKSKVTNFFKGVKNYLSGIKTGFVKGVNKLFKKNDDNGHRSKDIDSSEEDDADEKSFHHDDGDDFAELHQIIRKGFR